MPGGWSYRAPPTGFAITVATGTTSLSIPPPPGIEDGDTMLMCLSHKGAGYATVPAGWALVGQGISGATRGEMYWKRAASESGNYSVTGLAVSACGFILPYAGGLDVGDIVDVVQVQANASGTEDCAAITPTVPNALIIGMVAVGANNPVSSQAASPAITNFTYSERADGGTATGGGTRIAAADALRQPAASTNTFTYAITNAESVAILAAFIPEPADPTFADRFYPSYIAPNVRIDGAALGTWNGGYGTLAAWAEPQTRYLAAPSKVNAGTKRDVTLSTNQQGDYDVVWIEFFTPPLAAQTITGVFDLCSMIYAAWTTPSDPPAADSIVARKIHVCLMEGQTNTVKAVLVDNYVDTDNFPGPFDETGIGIWLTLDTAPTMVPAVAADGDTVRIVLGTRIRSSPTPTPLYPAPFVDDTYATQMIIRGIGTNASNGLGFPDATPGIFATTNLAPWFEFSNGLQLLNDPPDPPANGTCADAITIPSFPYQSDPIDTSQATGTEREVWFTFVAPEDGRIFFTAFGSTYPVEFDLFTGSCGSLLNSSLLEAEDAYVNRCLTTALSTVTQGTQYWLRVRNAPLIKNAPESGGYLRVQAFYRQLPEIDDLYLPCGLIVAFRRYPDGSLWPVNINPLWLGSAPTGIAFDYTERPMDDLNGGINTNVRALIGLHNFNLVEILNGPDLSFGDFQSEVDFIGDPINISGLDKHPAQLAISAAGELYIGYFGNGYLFVQGEGSLPRILNAISDVAAYAAPQSLSATDGDTQPGAPFTATSHALNQAPIAPWALSYSDAQGVLYYVSAGFYVPVGGQTIQRWNPVTATQLADFATLPSGGGPNPGMKGLEVLPDGSVLATNATYAVWLSAAGAVQQTYTPSRPELFQTMTDIKLTADGQRVWIVDETTTALALFDLVSGDEIAIYDTWLLPGTLVQMAIYQPDGIIIPVCPGIRGAPRIGV